MRKGGAMTVMKLLVQTKYNDGTIDGSESSDLREMESLLLLKLIPRPPSPCDALDSHDLREIYNQ